MPSGNLQYKAPDSAGSICLTDRSWIGFVHFVEARPLVSLVHNRQKCPQVSTRRPYQGGWARSSVVETGRRIGQFRQLLERMADRQKCFR